MKVEFDLPEQTLKDFIDAVDCYLEECGYGHCEYMDEADIENMKMNNEDLALAATQVGQAIHKNLEGSK